MLIDATIAWYGQKVGNFLSITRNKGLLSKLEEFEKYAADKEEKIDFRILNIAGNPMFVKMIDNYLSVGAVIELIGQHPHDVIPGAYLATQAGVIMTALNGDKFDLTNCLNSPADAKIQYILSNSKKISEELVETLKNTNIGDVG